MCITLWCLSDGYLMEMGWLSTGCWQATSWQSADNLLAMWWIWAIYRLTIGRLWAIHRLAIGYLSAAHGLTIIQSSAGYKLSIGWLSTMYWLAIGWASLNIDAYITSTVSTHPFLQQHPPTPSIWTQEMSVELLWAFDDGFVFLPSTLPYVCCCCSCKLCLPTPIFYIQCISPTNLCTTRDCLR